MGSIHLLSFELVEQHRGVVWMVEVREVCCEISMNRGDSHQRLMVQRLWHRSLDGSGSLKTAGLFHRIHSLPLVMHTPLIADYHM